MPRSSRHKSHKQHKHSSKEVKEYSDSEEVKERKDRDSEVAVRVSGSSEKRKLAVDGNSEEYTASKRRKERSSDVSGVDRWSGGDKDKDNKENKDRDRDRDGKGEGGSEKGLKSKVSVDPKSSSKSSRRHESSSEKKDAVNEIEEVKRNSSGSKNDKESKSSKDKEKDSKSKDGHQYKDSKDKDRDKDKDSKDSKDKERGAERSTKGQDARRERSAEKGSKVAVDNEGSRKFQELPAKPQVGNTEVQVPEDVRNPELDREHEKRLRKRRDSSDEKDGKYLEELKDSSGRRLSIKDERHKDERYKDDRYKEKYRDDLERDRVRDHRSRDDRPRDDRTSKDHTSERSDSRHSRDDSKSTIEYRHKKSKTQNIDRDGNPHHLEERDARYKDYRGKKRPSDDEDRSDLKPRSSKEHRYEVEKKGSSSKVESVTDKGRSQSRLVDGDSTSGGRRKSSPSSGTHLPNDSFRHSSKQAELKYRESDERARLKVISSREPSSVSGVPERTYEPQSTDKLKPVGKPSPKDNNLSELVPERSPKSDSQVSPVQLKEKSHSSTSIDRRPLNRTPVRRSSDFDESLRRSMGSKDGRDYVANDERGSPNWAPEQPVGDEFPHADGDTVSVSSSANRNSHLPPSSPSVLPPPPPPPLRTGVDSPVFSSFEEDNRGKSSNRYKRPSDHNMGRGQGNVWKWSSPVSNGYMPYQQGPPPVGFHPMMQQFHGPPFFGVRPGMELTPSGVPYHISDADRYSSHGRSFGWRRDETVPPHLHGWEGSNGVFGDDVHIHGKPEWDQNRHMMKDRSLDVSSEWKGQHNGPMNFPPASWKEDSHLRAPVDEVPGGRPGQGPRIDRNRSVSRAESIEIKTSDDIPIEQVPVEPPKPVVLEKAPEPSKTVNNRGFCSYYLSKLDISENLAEPEVYKQCVDLLDMEKNLTSSEVIRDISMEESENAGLRISSTMLDAPVFPKIKDSVFQRAMSLYKEQRDEMRAKFPIPSLRAAEPKIVPSIDMEVLPDQAIARQNQEPVVLAEGGKELISSPVEANVEVLDPAIDNDKGEECITASSNAIVENLVPTSGQAISAELHPYSVQVKQEEGETEAEPVSKFGSKELGEHVAWMNPVGGVDEDIGTTFDVENLVEEMEAEATLNELAKAGVDLTTASIPESLELAENQALTISNMVTESLSRDGQCNISLTSPEGQKDFSDDTIVTDGSGALAPMSVECKLVNLSRIHSPESTH